MRELFCFVLKKGMIYPSKIMILNVVILLITQEHANVNATISAQRRNQCGVIPKRQRRRRCSSTSITIYTPSTAMHSNDLLKSLQFLLRLLADIPHEIRAFRIFFVNSIVLKDRIKIISARYRSFDVSLLRNLGFVCVKM